MFRKIERRHNLMYLFDGAPPPLPDLPAGFDSVQVTQETLDTFMGADEFLSRKQRYENFLAHGGVGFLAVKDNQWAAAGWIAPPQMIGFPAHVPARISRQYDWLFEAHTYEPFRGKGLHKHLVVRRLEYLANRHNGIAKAVADVNPTNLPSRRSYIRLGFTPAGVMDIWIPHLPRIPRRPVGLWRKSRPHPSF